MCALSRPLWSVYDDDGLSMINFLEFLGAFSVGTGWGANAMEWLQELCWTSFKFAAIRIGNEINWFIVLRMCRVSMQKTTLAPVFRGGCNEIFIWPKKLCRLTAHCHTHQIFLSRGALHLRPNAMTLPIKGYTWMLARFTVEPSRKPTCWCWCSNSTLFINKLCPFQLYTSCPAPRRDVN